MVKEIDFGGQKRPVKFGWNALATFGDLTGTGLNDLIKFSNEMTFSEVLVLIYAGLKEGARASGVTFDIIQEQIGDWLDEDTGKVQEFIEIFQDQMPKAKKE